MSIFMAITKCEYIQVIAKILRNKLTYNHLTLNQNDATGHVEGINERNTFSKELKIIFQPFYTIFYWKITKLMLKNVH